MAIHRPPRTPRATAEASVGRGRAELPDAGRPLVRWILGETSVARRHDTHARDRVEQPVAALRRLNHPPLQGVRGVAGLFRHGGAGLERYVQGEFSAAYLQTAAGCR